jgi:CheY-like chemotaxis protein
MLTSAKPHIDIILDDSLTIVEFNSSLKGVSFEPLEGRHISEVCAEGSKVDAEELFTRISRGSASIESVSGRIELTSKEGSQPYSVHIRNMQLLDGHLLVVAIPMRESESEVLAVAGAKPITRHERRKKRRLRVLAVDDEAGTEKQLGLMLMKMCEKVHTASSAEEAIALSDKHDFDLVFTDIMMPGMSGVEMIRHFREEGKMMPFVLFSADNPKDFIDEGHYLGIIAYLQKPLSLNDLIAVLNKAEFPKCQRRTGLLENDEVARYHDQIMVEGKLECLEKFKAVTSGLFTEDADDESGKKKVKKALDKILRFQNAAYEPSLQTENGKAISDWLDQRNRAMENGNWLSYSVDDWLDKEISIDRSAIFSILESLIDNAEKFSKMDSIYVDVGIDEEKGSAVVIEVMDHGTGMRESLQQEIFEPFFQSSLETEGFGLGLATVMKIVTASGGCINVSSAPKAGARFVVTLPK